MCSIEDIGDIHKRIVEDIHKRIVYIHKHKAYSPWFLGSLYEGQVYT